MYVSYNILMPKSSKSPVKLAIHFNLLKPQSNPEKLLVKLIRWLLSSGRYIFVLVEGLVLIAFIARFKFDADLQTRKEAIEEQIPYIESLKAYEIIIRQTQLKLSIIDNAKKNLPDFPVILKRISNQVPLSVKIATMNMTSNTDSTATIHISGQTSINNDLTSFLASLKEDNTFSNVNLANIGFEQGVIKFTIDLVAKPTNQGKSL